ncbi:MAG: RNA polymerase sigma factor [Chitinophagaceae bacterium]
MSKSGLYLLNEQSSIMLKGCIAGDRSCQNKLYEEFSGKMFPVCLRYTGNREDAEDVLQEGFIKVFTHIREFKNEGSLEGWIRKIMVNTALEKYRKQSHLYPVKNMEETAEMNLFMESEDIISRLTTKELILMIQSLPPRYRMVFNLYVFEGMKHREIADELGISEGTSKSNLSDARAILQKKVTDSLKIAKPREAK